jgi:protein-L-isoaspartate(D-aspartate) O-methyltransferase
MVLGIKILPSPAITLRMESFEEQRARLVESLKRRGYISTISVEAAMLRVPREEFLPESIRDDAYVDTPLPIGDRQTVSAPHMVAIMVEHLDLRPGMKVLEIGAGSGYHAAVCAEIVGQEGHIYTVERISSLSSFAEANLKKTGYASVVTVIFGDGTKGLPEHAPYDRIFVAAGAPYIPPPLTEQIAEGGRLLVPVGGRFYQDLIRIEKRGAELKKESLGGCVFVPLIGEHGYH